QKLKVSGTIDLARPESAVTIAPTVKEDWQSWTLTITGKKGKKDLGDITNRFAVSLNEAGDLVVKRLAGAALEAGTACTATLTV
ncbi:MAG: hypothetical protein IKE30_05900, partial [Clostridia bacterium]|nr:hypothetical protein [Clostridia bacterium]